MKKAKEGFMADALAYQGEEGRDKLRKATGRSTHPVIRRWPNGVTRPAPNIFSSEEETGSKEKILGAGHPHFNT